MQRFRFPIAVAATSLVLVLGLAVAGGLLAGSVVAGGLPWRGASHGGPIWAGGHIFGAGPELPPELAELHDVPADQRFDHFKGAQVHLTDKDGRPLTIDITPGIVSATGANSITLRTNDGPTKAFTLDDQTVVRGRQTPEQDDRAAVVTLNSSSSAQAVIIVPRDGSNPWGRHLGWGM